MEEYASLLRKKTSLRATCMPVTTGAPQVAVDRIMGFPFAIGAVFILGADAGVAMSLRRDLIAVGGPAVLTELELVHAVLAAETITMLRRQGVPAGHGRVILAGAPEASLLGPLLIASGVKELSTWTVHDRAGFPLAELMRRNDVLVNATGQGHLPVEPRRVVSRPPERFTTASLLLPGLMSALCGHGVKTVSMEMMAAAVAALALVTPPSHRLPSLDEGLLVPAVARRVGGAIAHTNGGVPFC